MIKRKEYEEALRPFVGKNIIKVLVGARRVGKSTLLKLIREGLEEQGVSRDAMVHIDFESARFSKMTTADALSAYIAQRVDPTKKHYVFFDEIQEVQGWEKALRSFMVDYDIDLYVTGSNARMLSSDLATYITGRYVQIPVFPFSFAEFFRAFQAVGQGPNSRKAFARYVEQGGFPFQYDLEFEKDASLQYLQDVYSTILLKDVVQKNEFRDTDQLLRIMQYAIQEIGHSFSAKSVSDYLKSEHRSVSVDTVYNYLRAAEAACLLYRVGREDAIGKKILKFNEKFYLVDHGIREALGYSNTASIDQVLENIVCMELKRRGYSVTVGKVGQKEVDFIARHGDEIAYYQVAYLLADEKVIEREFSALEAVSDNYPKYVLSLDEFAPERGGIKGVNLIDWLLG
ncbi:ATP-binding protein [Gordonibacter sp.]|uniref:ATP-binding protein n=1 Tax=Gordonibacter sp. TaxID=1968902 RepID=UPI002FCC501F